jgi:hypothetical protein
MPSVLQCPKLLAPYSTMPCLGALAYTDLSMRPSFPFLGALHCLALAPLHD